MCSSMGTKDTNNIMILAMVFILADQSWVILIISCKSMVAQLVLLYYFPQA